MFLGSPLPLSPDLPLSELFGLARPPGPLGAWVRPCPSTLRLHQLPFARRRVLASSDLGFLLSRCNNVALREGEQLVVLEAEKVIHWRALQVATATPYLPGVDHLRAQFPGLRPDAGGLVVPIKTRSPEEVLAECLAIGIQVAGSRIVYSVPPESEPDAEREPVQALHCAPGKSITS